MSERLRRRNRCVLLDLVCPYGKVWKDLGAPKSSSIPPALRLSPPIPGWHQHPILSLESQETCQETEAKRRGLSRIKFLLKKKRKTKNREKEIGEGEIGRNWIPAGSAFIYWSSSRRWLHPDEHRSKLYFPAALPLPGLPLTCQSSLLKCFGYSTSPTAGCSCMPPSSAQLAFHTATAPF